MQYLRMLTNSLVGGALTGAYVTLLVLQLNPGLRLDAAAVAPVVLTWWLLYGLHATVFFYVLIVFGQLLAVEVRSPGWISLRLLAAFGTLAVSMATVVTWLNLRGFRSVLGPDAAARMTSGATALSVCAASCLAIALLQLILKRGRRLAAAMFAALLLTSLVVPVVLRGVGTPGVAAKVVQPVTNIAAVPSTARVTMILLDGASMDFIAPAAASGRVPNFGRLLETGAVMHLATLRPTQPAPVWTAVATGKLPYKTSVYSAARYAVPRSTERLDLLPDFCFAQALVRFGVLAVEAPTAAAIKARSMWQLLDSFGITTGVIDWPVTYPANAVNGYLVSDEFLRRNDPSVFASVLDEPPLASPPDVLDLARAARVRAVPGTASVALAASRTLVTQSAEGLPAPINPVATDAAAEQIAHDLELSHPVQFTAVRYPGIDAVGHYYLRYAMPRAFGDVSDQERDRFGRVLEQYYSYVDGIVGKAMGALGPEDLLLVVSGFGMDPLGLGKRLLERAVGDAELSGTHESAPDGFLMAFGRGVAKGSFPRASVVDVAPTVLYFLGLPVPRDMDGYARTDIFSPTFTEQRPITFIPYYDR
jgi:Type I phosphodiesterase / nucleotide pyrophosphatase